MRIFLYIAAASLLQASVLAGQEVVIGALEGPPEVLFGRIEDLGSSGGGQIVTLDGQSPVPLVFSADGTFLGQLGASGQGPGEFKGPVVVGVSNAGRVAVVDTRNSRVSLHQLGQDGGTFLGSFRLEHPIGDVCWLGDRLFAVNWRGTGGSLLLEYGPDGQVVNRFGERIRPEGALATVFGDEPPTTLNDAKIACDEDRQIIAFASELTGEVRVYSAQGELRWATIAPAWTMVHIRRSSRGDCCGFSRPEEGYYHRARSVAFDGPHVVVGAELIGFEDIESFAFRATDGGFTGLRDDEQFLVDVLADGRKVGFRVSPISQVVVWR